MLAAMRSIGGDGSGARLLLAEDDEPEASLAAGALSRVADVTHVTTAEDAETGATARYWARHTNARFVEPLEVFRETHSAVAFETFVGHGAPALTDVA